MLRSKYRFSLDIKLTQSQVSIPVMLNDTIWGFYINLIDNGKPFLLPDGCRAVFVAKKPDGNTLFNDCIIERNHIIRYDFTANTTNVEGIAPCEIRVYGPSCRMLTCPRFTMVVDHRVLLDDEIVLSESEHTTIDSIIASEYARQQAEKARDDAEKQRAETAVQAAQAVEKAEQAVVDANKAVVDANKAVVDANKALDDANAATETANQASQAANKAAQDAQTASQAAQDAQNSAEGALEEAQQATQRAEQAATSAQSSADAATTGISNHNTNREAHQYILDELAKIKTKLDNFFGVSVEHPEALDALSELIDAITENAEDIEAITANNVKYSDIVDRLDNPSEYKVLSAKQGVELNRLIEEVRAQIGTAIADHNKDGTAHAGLHEMVDNLDTAVVNLSAKVTALENAKPNLEGYVTTSQFEAALGSYITDIDTLVGGGL